jgi:hypothetical protein
MHLHPADSVPVAPAQGDVAALRPGMPSRLRRRLLWAGGAVALVALLVVTPPLVSANRYRNKIAQAMSQSLGRPVHLDNVSLHLLPVPGFTLQNFVVSEDPAFGAEPTIRANQVEATLRVSSLWRRPVEFSTVRFVEPSVNLVRNAEGRWNLSDILLHAAHVESAPTVQRTAGPTPRFPYIEATGGRVNVKLGSEKLPFSLTDADFALWLPSPRQWRVRLLGQPARTDTNITDPGRLRIEGTLGRANQATAVPVNFTASWHDAPLGEATRILAGDDWGWRGSLNLDTTLVGNLGAAQVAGKLTLGGLRRAEFFPTHPLDLQITCGSRFALHPAALADLDCALPDAAPEPIRLQAAHVGLQRPGDSPFSIQGTQVPVRWALLWAALFSARVPTDLHPAGTVDVNLHRNRAAEAAAPALDTDTVQPAAATTRRHRRHAEPVPAVAVAQGWAGELRLRLPASGEQAGGNILLWQVQSPSEGTWPALRLAPVAIPLDTGGTLNLTGSISETGYILSATGAASPAAILEPARYLPQLGDGLESVLTFPPTSLAPIHLQITCERSWSSLQTCTGAGSRREGSAPAQGVVPGVSAAPGAGFRDPRGPALAPRNLSPLEQAPFSTPRPSTTAPQP